MPVRFRPMLLTAAAVVVGASVILFDPIFQGLALSLMAGEVAPTFISRMTVPVLYYIFKNRYEAISTHKTPSGSNRLDEVDLKNVVVNFRQGNIRRNSA